jgi:imidazolonepropionase-like amidohydrolase
MTPQAALAAATTATASLFQMSELGLVEVGYAADLLVVDGDPLVYIGALRQPRAVIARGVPVSGEGLESPPG